MGKKGKYVPGKQLMGFQGWWVKSVSGQLQFLEAGLRSIPHYMKTACFALVLLAAGSLKLHAQTSNPATVSPTNQAGVPPPTAYQVVNRGPNNKVWQRETYEKLSDGTIVSHKHQYTELATGLNYQQNGQWVDSKQEIDVLPDGTAAATQGQHQVYFPADIYQGAIQVTTPDGLQLKSQPAALVYDDGTSTVLIGVLTNSVGQLLNTNQAIYTNAFTGVWADVVYEYKIGGIEQNIVIRSQLPSPESLGLNPDTTKLQIMTEFFNPPEPIQAASSRNGQDGLSDMNLTFGKMRMAHGNAFSIGTLTPADQSKKIPVYKSWQNLQGRHFLIESVPYRRIKTELKQLSASARNPENTYAVKSRSHSGSTVALLPPTHPYSKNGRVTKFARADLLQEKGVVVDYNEIVTNEFDWTFQGDATYLISGILYFDGTTTIEGGAVIKYSSPYTQAYLEIDGSLVCNTAPYRPAVFTSSDDNSVGEPIAGSSGSPTPNWAVEMLSNQGGSTNISNLRFSYAECAFEAGGWCVVKDCQFYNCLYPVNIDSVPLTMQNDLFSQCICALCQAEVGDISAENLTVDQCGIFCENGYDDQEFNVYVTNSMFTSTTNVNVVGPGYTNDIVMAYCHWETNGNVIYQKVGGGEYYLATESPYHNYGTTNIDPGLLADIATKTTYPPVLYSNTTISAATTFSPQAERDIDAVPDIGYHYDPLDYVFGLVNSTSNLTFTAGTAVGFERCGTFNQSYGISITNGMSVTFAGTATSPCMFVYYSMVQEGKDGPSEIEEGSEGIVNQTADNPANPPTLYASFTKFLHLDSDSSCFRDGSSSQPLIIQATDCEMLNAIQGNNMLGAFTNCLFDRVDFWQDSSASFPYEHFENCTFHGGSFDIIHAEGGAPYWYSSVANCAFDGTIISVGDPFGTNTAYGNYNYNAFDLAGNQFPGQGTNKVVVTNFNWQASWYGNYYLPANSSLINAGNTTANLVGLYHFTTQANQTVEGDSIVDMGYHYVAADQNGNPLDTNGDGTPDYLEDSNGNGIFDAGDLGNWLIGPFNGLSATSGLSVFTPLK